MPLLLQQKNKVGIIALILSIGCAVVSPLAFGAVHPLIVSIFAGIALLSLGLHIVARTQERRKITISWVGLPIFLTLTFAISMVTPLPHWLRQFLSPNATKTLDLVASNLPVSIKDSVLPVLSLDPPETFYRIVQLVAALCIFIVVADQGRNRSMLKFIFRMVLAGAFVLLTISIGHRILNITQIWGQFAAANTPLFAPMINTNHLARTFGIFSLLTLAGSFYYCSRIERFWFCLASVLCGGGVLLTLSRGGILFYGFTFFILILSLLFIHRKDRAHHRHSPNNNESLKQLLPLGAVGILALAVGLFIAYEGISQEIFSIDQKAFERKTELYTPFMSLLKEHWRVGIGPGSLAASFYSQGSVANEYLLPEIFLIPFFENIVLQSIIDHGIIKFLLLFAVICWLIFALVRHMRGPMEYTLFAALIFVVASDLVDFSIETGTVLWLTAITIGLLAARLAKQQRYRVRLPIIQFAPVYFLLVIGSTMFVYRSIADNSLQMKGRILQNDNVDIMTLQSALAKHPFDYFYSGLLAGHARKNGDFNDAKKWAKTTTHLCPTCTGAHLELARSNFVFGKTILGLVEYRKAWLLNPRRGKEILEEVQKFFPKLDDLSPLIPRKEARYYVVLCRYYKKKERIELGKTCFDTLFELPDATLNHKILVVQTAIQHKDKESAKTKLEKLLKNNKVDGSIARLAARVIALTEGDKVALEKSESWLENCKEPKPLLLWRLSAAWRTQQHKVHWATIEDVEKLPNHHKYRRRLQIEKAKNYDATGKTGETLKILRELNSSKKLSISLMLWQARTEFRLGLYQHARKVLRRMKKHYPSHYHVGVFERKLKRKLLDRTLNN